MDERPFEHMNMVPFIDIMLVLLVIVLTTSSFIASGRIPVHLPQASAQRSERDPRETRTIDIDAAGTAHFEGRPLSVEALKEQLAPMDKATPFLLRADRTVQLQRFVDVADALKQLGISRVAVQTQSTRP
ncbi:ExbD/TolR family protein [Azohydromonas lata]|uniref:ExbD/TolR family protein n=1 Tax=Azohydromonas lata TaxID=45677 RepID=UPI000831FD10|nr:biopolymer transporter ExbD [Azohydromonas lata]